MSYKPVFFIDFEAFQHGGEDFIIKELSILDASNPQKSICYVFRSPCAWDSLKNQQRRTYSYQHRRLHNLSWNEGCLRYCRQCLLQDIKHYMSANGVYYVMGQQKADFLQRQFPDLTIRNYATINGYVDDLTYKDLSPAPAYLLCPYRNHGREHCAVLKCYRMYQHFCHIISPAKK